MTKLEECARAIHAEAKSEDYTGDYAFRVGLTTLDGTFNLEAFARAVIRCLMEPSDTMLHTATMEAPTWDDDASRRKIRAMLQSVLDEKA